jgi:hypothetical protein
MSSQEFRMVVSTMTGAAPRAEKNGTIAASELLESAAPVSPVHISCVKVRQQVLKVTKNRRPKASCCAHPLKRGRSSPCSTAR